MYRIITLLCALSLLVACEANAPVDTKVANTEPAALSAKSSAPAPVAPAPAAALSAKPEAKGAAALTSVSPSENAPSACGGGAEAKGASCGNPDCVYAEGKKSEGPGPDCPHELASKKAAPTPVAPEAKHFGAAFALVANQPLSKSLKTKEDKVFQVTGTIDKVCRKKGCWMVLKDGESTARVLMKDYGFTVPVNCDGKVAAVEGTLKTRTFTEGQAKHLAEDGGEDPSKVKGTRTEYVITASGIRIQG